MLRKIGLFAAAAVFMAPAIGHADAIGTMANFSLTQDGCSGTCGTGPFGTVNLDQTATGVVTVTVTIAPDKFVSTGAGDALEFNLNGDPLITIGNITAGFSVGPAPDKASTFGNFDYSVTCSGCGSGGSNPLPGPLSFTVTDAAGVNVSDFIGNGSAKDPSTNYFFAADIMGSNGNTGNVAALAGTVTTATPEPSSLILLGSGLLGAAGLLRRKLFS